MSWGLVWAPAALRDFYDVPNWTTAARIDEAISRFARGDGGAVRKVRTADGDVEFYLLVPPYRVRFSRDRSSRTLILWRIVRYA